MGPILIFDKSALEGLNPDEAMWLDTFFLTNFTPVFFIETLADLEKEVRKGRTPEQVVGGLASKSPENGRANAHHRRLLEGELSGEVPLDLVSGRPNITGGRRVELGDKTGVIFQPSPEDEALTRWRRGEFRDLERQQAKAWRAGLSGIDFEEQYRWFQRFFPLGRPKNLADVKALVDFHVQGFDQEAVLRFALGLQGVTPTFVEEILSRWRAAGKPPIGVFAPYLTHLFSVDLFFYFGIAADLIGRHRPSHKVDLAYLYYLPFCGVFTSNDKLHLDIAPHFLRPNQSLVRGTDLKADLGALETHYDAFPEEVKERGVITFASTPPPDDRFLIARLWDKHMAPTWRQPARPLPPLNSPEAKAIAAEIEKMIREGKPVGDAEGGAEPDSMIIQRTVRPQRGKWKIFPPEVLNRRRNAEGEWEDVPPEGQR